MAKAYTDSHAPSHATPPADDRSHADPAPGGPAAGRAVGAGYEPDDVKVRGILIFLLWFAVGVGVVEGLIVFVRNAMVHYTVAEQTADYGPPDERPHRPPPDPMLQPAVGHESTDREDMDRLRAEQEAALTGGGWRRDDRNQLVLTAALIEKVAGLLAAPSTRPAPTGPEQPAPTAPTPTPAPAPVNSSGATQPATPPAGSQPSEADVPKATPPVAAPATVTPAAVPATEPAPATGPAPTTSTTEPAATAPVTAPAGEPK